MNAEADLWRAGELAPSPCYVVVEERLRRNGDILAQVRERTGCKILLALKGFAMHAAFPLLRKYLNGVCASSVYEARLGREAFGKEVHAYAPAFTEEDMAEHLGLSDHLVFNSLAQWRRFREQVAASARPISMGLRVNPLHSEGTVPLYDPAAPGSRLGIPPEELAGLDLAGIDGLHFHTLCEQNSDALARTWEAVRDRFDGALRQVRWLNLGGGHHITRGDYDLDLLAQVINDAQERYGVEVYLEPGEAVALATGILVATVLDITENSGHNAILDVSVTAHMPDVLEMPYRPMILGAGEPREKAHTYRLGGLSCLAGDVAGAWSFDEPLKTGQRLIFMDMAHYTMVKTTHFNGVRHPSIALYSHARDELRVVREFGYADYRDRLS